MKLLDSHALTSFLRRITRCFPQPSAVAIGIAGARTEADWQRVRSALAALWPGVPCRVTHDLETALVAAEIEADTPSGQGNSQPPTPHRLPRNGRIPKDGSPPLRVLILSGTGSCCYGRTTDGREAKVGGWGHLLGDRGSGYQVGLLALQTVIRHFEESNHWPPLGARILRSLQQNDPEMLVGWAHAASKAEIAQIAVEVFQAEQARDPIARRILSEAADQLVHDALVCGARLREPRQRVEFVFAGGCLVRQAHYRRLITERLQRRLPRAAFRVLRGGGAAGALELARRLYVSSGTGETGSIGRVSRSNGNVRSRVQEERIPIPDVSVLHGSPTEQRNPRSERLDRLSLKESIELMLDEEGRVPQALVKEAGKIARAIGWIRRALSRKGRLFYIGAGTSGRLGVLDASECPPTFRTPPELVQGIIAGGQSALWQSIEGAEDDPEAGAQALRFRKVTSRDVVVGIAASGRTPFVWGGLAAARRAGAKTILLCFNPAIADQRRGRPDLTIAVDVGPEVLTGSTRLKCGTATKMALNLLTTLAMVGLGKVKGNFMVDLDPSNSKLRDRAVRIVQQLQRVEPGIARGGLEACDWNIRAACAKLGRKTKRTRIRS